MSRSETKQRIPHTLIDNDFFEKPENLEAVELFGDMAPAAILRVCFKLINEREARMKKSQVLAMWMSTGTKKNTWAEIIEYYIRCGWLVEKDEYLTSVRVGKERARVENKRSILSANGKQKHSKSEANKQQSASISSDTDTDTVTEYINKNGLKKVGVHVYLTDISKDLVKKRFLDEQLNIKDIKRAIEYLDKHFDANPEKRFPVRDHRLDLIGWPLDQVRKTKSELERAKPPDKRKTVPASESQHPALRAQREQDAKEALQRLGMGGLAK